MPELPEVETVVRGLNEILSHHPRVKEVTFARADLRDPMPKKKIRQIEGLPILGIQRRSKYILFETKVGWLISHLGMTGSWRFADAAEKQRKHDHVEIIFEDGLRLRYHDPRRFGVLDFAADLAKSPRLIDLGLEPLTDAFTGESFKAAAKGRSAPIKNVLMDAGTVVGVGNIYASESLFRAGIRPKKAAEKLTIAEWKALAKQVKLVLQEAIDGGGSTISDYISAKGTRGDFQNRFRVYDRAGEPCVACKTAIRKIVLGGRSTYFCPSCQR